MTHPSSSSPLPPAAGATPSIDDPQRLETSPPTTSPALESTPVGSRYLLDYLIGQGAWGRVWHGRRRSDGAPVAIKVLRAEYAADPEVVSRLLRERSLLQELRHPHLVEVEDLVVEGDTFAVVMELVDGVDLRRMAQRGELGMDEALAVLAQVAQALAYVHAEGILHRDVKPENVLVCQRDHRVWAQLTDFGLAWLADGQRLTVGSRVLGTPAYLAPELLSGHPYGTAVDVYALGVTAYELLSGQRPFNGEHPMALMRAHLDDQPSRPPHMTQEHWRVIRACLAKDPQQRPTAAELAGQLADLCDSQGVRLCIDFGTATTTAIMCWPDGRTEPLRFDDSTLLPSAVYANPDGTILTGRAAVAAGLDQPQHCEPYPRLRIANGRVPLGDQDIDPVDLVAAVLRRVAREARHRSDGTPVRTTLTHPANWSTAKLTLLLRAAHVAGLPNPQLVAEPMAAAAQLAGAPATDLPTGAHVVIYDLGAATTTASVVRRTTAGGFDIIATEELSDAGGIDIDAAILDHLGELFSAGAPQDWQRLSRPENPPDRCASWLLLRDVQHAKETLSQSTTTNVAIPLIDQEVSLDRELIDRLTRPILERTVGAVYTALASAGVAADDLAAIFPIGGASRMPLVATVLAQALGREPTTVGQRQLVVARGAARLPLTATLTDNDDTHGGPGSGWRSADPDAVWSDDYPGTDVALSRAAPADPGVHRHRSRRGTDSTAGYRNAGHGSDGYGNGGYDGYGGVGYDSFGYRGVGRGRRMAARMGQWSQHKLVTAAAVLVVATAATAAYEWWPAQSSDAKVVSACGYKIAYLGSPTGYLSNSAGPRAGVTLAVEEYNAQHPDCTVTLVTPGSTNPSNGTAADPGANEIAADRRVLGVVSPLPLAQSEVAVPILDQAGVATISPTLNAPAHARSGYGVFHRTVGTDFDDITSGLRQLKYQLNAAKVFVVDDGAPDSLAGAAYAKRLLGTGALAGAASMGRITDRPALIAKIATSKADAVYYTGFPEQFSAFVDFAVQLHATLPTVTLAGWQSAYNDQSVAAGGQQPPDNLHLTCTCRPPDRDPRDFTERFRQRYNTTPARYAAEAFDAANILLSGLAAGEKTRSTMLTWVDRYEGNGVSGRIKFSSTGDLIAPRTWALRFVNGAIVVEDPIADNPAAS